MLKLYGAPPTRALRVLWLLNELGLKYEMIPLEMLKREHKSAAFRALNPAGKVPVLVDGDFVLTESSAIRLYLAEKNPKAGFIPESIERRAEMYRWIFFLVTEIEQPLWRIAHHSFIYPEDKRLPQEIELARQDCKEMVAVLEAHMVGRDFIVGDRLSVADFNAAYTMDWANELELLEDAPSLRTFLKRMYHRPTAPPTIAQAMAKFRQEQSQTP